VGFEPTDPFNGVDSLARSCLRPLSHASKFSIRPLGDPRSGQSTRALIPLAHMSVARAFLPNAGSAEPRVLLLIGPMRFEL
jgi:hypothetical protein